MEYLFILLGWLVISLFWEWRYHIHLYQSRNERLIIPIFFFVVGVVWDSFAVWRGHWFFNFNSHNLTGIKIGVLPLEEYLFFLIVPYGILTFYKVLQKKIK